MASELDKLKVLLAGLFQLDLAEDLDFGMYRVLRLRRRELQRFLDETLEAEVRAAMGSLASGARAKIEARMREIEAQASRFGGRADADPEYAELKKRLEAAGDATARERQVYAHLGEFLSRYYEDGDFLSLPRIRDANGRDAYAIPYDGSEVVLHWANKDQYYVKSGEYFARYAWALADGRRVVFRLVDAETDPDNVKSADAGKRRFRLIDGPDAVRDEGGELVLRFVYTAEDGKQAGVNATTEERVRSHVPATWAEGLFAPSERGSDPKPTALGWHLQQYTERNKRDYFIHKDLGGFLRRELDHYLKTEVFDLDAVEEMSTEDTMRSVELVRTIRKVARPVVTFLATMEDFQKRLFLKRKLVLRTDWCVTLDRVDERFYARIAENKAQVARWKELFAIDTIEAPPLLGGDAKGETVSATFLKRNPGLLLETRLFDKGFTAELLASFGSLDDALTGVVVRSENLQGLRFLAARYGASVDAVYIDPPYNTDASPIVYKNGYQRSSWASAIADRLHADRVLRKPRALRCVAIDDFEHPDLRLILDAEPGSQQHGTAVVRSKPQGRPTTSGFSPNHEYALFFGPPDGVVGRLPRSGSKAERYPHSDSSGIFAWANLRKSGTDSARADRPKSYYPIYVSRDDAVRIPRMQWDKPTERWNVEEPPRADEVVVWPVDTSGDDRVWNCSPERLREEIADVRVIREGNVQITKKYRPHQGGALPGTWWDDPAYSASESGTKTIKDMFAAKDFDYPKSVNLVVDCLRAAGLPPGGLALDYFGGSGTTAHAVINLNREDEGRRKFILVEVNDYFESVLLPRILKATYAKDWKDGKPVAAAPVPGGALYKVLYLESYEDTLANLALPAEGTQAGLFTGALHREYVVRYLLDRETKGAHLDLDRFRRPFGWTMEVRRGGLVEAGHPIDLVETFNYLIGLTVRRVGHFISPDTVRYVKGSVREGGDTRKVLVLWRDCDAVSDATLARYFQDREFAPVASREYDVIYVNGDPAPLENLRRDGELWKVRAIEDTFERLSFAEDVGV